MHGQHFVTLPDDPPKYIHWQRCLPLPNVPYTYKVNVVLSLSGAPCKYMVNVVLPLPNVPCKYIVNLVLSLPDPPWNTWSTLCYRYLQIHGQCCVTVTQCSLQTHDERCFSLPDALCKIMHYFGERCCSVTQCTGDVNTLLVYNRMFIISKFLTTFPNNRFYDYCDFQVHPVEFTAT